MVQAAASSSAAPSTQTKRRVRHILLPVDQSNLFTKLQHDLAGECPKFNLHVIGPNLGTVNRHNP